MALIKTKKRMLGNITFIGELYKKQMLRDRIMHFCIMRLLGLVSMDSGTPVGN